MKLLEALNSNRPMIYYASYNLDSGWNDFNGTTPDADDFNDAIREGAGDYDIDEGSVVTEGIWVGYKFHDPVVQADDDEDGPTLYENIDVEVVIITANPIPKNHPIFNKVSEEVEQSAQELIDEEKEAMSDMEEERRDPYGYRGLRKSDFY